MAESGLRPVVPRWQRALLRGVAPLTSPRTPDDYVQMLNPRWSSRELRGTVERVDAETADATTLTIRPCRPWPGHQAGQYLRIGVDIDGVRHWRAYSLSSDAGRTDGLLQITVKRVAGGAVSPYLTSVVRPGTIVTLGGVEGTFTLPDPAAGPLLLLTAGSGVTPVMAILRGLDARGALDDVVHVHSAPTAETTIFAAALTAFDARHPGLTLHVRHTRADGRLAPDGLDTLVPDWRTRQTLACGPASMLAALSAHWDAAGLRSRLRLEHFAPHLEPGVGGTGGTVTLTRSGVTAFAEGGQPLLAAAEDAGVAAPFGCRMGICQTCVRRLVSGRVRDLRTGEVHGEPGRFIRTCVNAAEGPVELEL
ncbi:NADPH oxidoreductase [Paraconexibacter sp. AEG42_29]|uniref:NADPH oxidoreductase n=1 Tax=Paraconexibacter sp. AEG42_29 TaxID=2997339 RepID=A0AAU7AUM4_9ACTN